MIAVLTLLFAVSAPIAAAATDPTTSQYCDGLGTGSGGGACADTQGEKDSGGTLGTQSGGSGGAVAGEQQAGGLGSRVSSLPFTGWDLLSMAAISLSLVCGGIAVSRLADCGGLR